MRINPRIIYIIFGIAILLVTINNASYYWYTKTLLKDDLSARMASTALQIRTSIEQSKEGSFYTEDLIGEKLRTAAMFIHGQLSPDLNQITNDQLRALAKQAGVAGISLMQRVAGSDDIAVRKSSEPNELKITSTKPFGYWFTAYDQLLTNHNVTIPEGQSLANFWSGIAEVPASGASEVSKFGFYNDGSTDYIIAVFVNADQVLKYQEIVGSDTIVKKTIAVNPDIIEIAGLNGITFGKPPKMYTDNNGASFMSIYDRPVLFGSYEIKHADDIDSFTEAVQTNKPVSSLGKWKGKTVLKTFVYIGAKTRVAEVQRDIPYVIAIVSDYSSVERTLNMQLVRLALLVVLFTIFSILCMYLVFRFMGKSKENAVRSTQELYIQNMDVMFTEIRSQRHDFLNHVQTMYALLSRGKKEEQLRYMEELIEEINEVNDIIRIGHPAVAALIQAKLAQAMRTKILFDHHFTGLEGLSLGVKSVDIVKIIGNLIDNAFDEVSGLAPELRHVIVKGWSETGMLYVSVANLVQDDFDPARVNQMFGTGFSTKVGGEHSGLGLAVVKERIEFYKGTIDVKMVDGYIHFQLGIPML
ncbi:sensor histidine kinase [Paenibacillus lignilyticus]|uniref:GHKL domain-containing protein n=1 Tax=Paenibacillus lignilyticus TaxID=1172615 RepID=A0ABS5CIG1_9BACL|nr:GHKL domain-containing protein [Paenibacillus lignilyticus]MBP3965661.1 GHKL domain-containing protein [Paenibacillus lignilyticus]